MPPDVHLHPDRLRRHAVTAARLGEALVIPPPAPDASAAVPASGGIAVEAERLCIGMRRAARELAELAAALTEAAQAAETVDGEVARAVRRVADRP